MGTATIAGFSGHWKPVCGCPQKNTLLSFP
jgi:hypothetical protein